MKPSMQQTTSLRQELRMNPRLYQAMDLLYMPLLDLQQHLKQELLVNRRTRRRSTRSRTPSGSGKRRRRRRKRTGRTSSSTASR
jgi:DNA-directed RNA polymerase specialized sigma54-like protein